MVNYQYLIKSCWYSSCLWCDCNVVTFEVAWPHDTMSLKYVVIASIDSLLHVFRLSKSCWSCHVIKCNYINFKKINFTNFLTPPFLQNNTGRLFPGATITGDYIELTIFKTNRDLTMIISTLLQKLVPSHSGLQRLYFIKIWPCD